MNKYFENTLMPTSPVIRYMYEKNLNKLALDLEHANLLSKFLKHYEFTIKEQPCLNQSSFEGLIKKFKESKEITLFIKHKSEIDSLEFLTCLNLSILLLSIHHDIRIYTRLLSLGVELISSMLTTSFISMIHSEHLPNAKNGLKILTFLCIAKFYKPDFSIKKLLDWGIQLDIFKSVSFEIQMQLEQAFNEPTVCSIWQKFLYNYVIQKRAPEASINVIMRRKEIVVICNEINKRFSMVEKTCEFDGFRELYFFINNLVSYFSPLARTAKKYVSKKIKKEYNKIFIDSLKLLLPSMNLENKYLNLLINKPTTY